MGTRSNPGEYGAMTGARRAPKQSAAPGSAPNWLDVRTLSPTLAREREREPLSGGRVSMISVDHTPLAFGESTLSRKREGK